MTRFGTYPNRPIHPATLKGFVILCNTHDACSSFWDIFDATRKNRGAKGAPTDEEQDLLRAMLVFASAGLDSMVKQLIVDALPTTIGIDPGAMALFEKNIEKWLADQGQLDRRFLAAVLVSESPRAKLVGELVDDLTSGSLQSKDQLLRAAAFFGIPSRDLTDGAQEDLRNIFDARNQIAHEMDIDFDQANRNRRPRARDTMVAFTTEILRVSSVILTNVDARIP